MTHGWFLYVGESVELTVKLAPEQQLQDEETLKIAHLHLCQQVGSDTCFNRLTVMVSCRIVPL